MLLAVSTRPEPARPLGLWGQKNDKMGTVFTEYQPARTQQGGGQGTPGAEGRQKQCVLWLVPVG